MAYRDVILADSPIYYWEFSETSGANLNSGSLTMGGTAQSAGITRTNTGKYGNAWGLTAKTQRFYNALADTVPFTDKVFSVETWIKPNAGSGNDYLWYLGATASTATQNIIYLYKQATTNVPFLYMRGSGTGRSIAGTTNLGDGNWHHVVVTVNGDVITMYVDGVSQGTSTAAIGTFTPATARITFGDPSSSVSAIGLYDETAIYNYVLTPTQVSNHYNNVGTPTSVNAGYTAEVMTASGTMLEGSATGNVQTVFVDKDAYRFSGHSANGTGNSQFVYVGTTTGTNARGFFGIPSPVLPAGEGVADAKLVLTRSQSNLSTNLNIYRIDADWDEATFTGATSVATTLVGSMTVPAGSMGDTFTVDIDAALVGTNYGVALATDNSSTVLGVYSSDEATLGYRPKVLYATAPSTNASYAAQTMDASAIALDPTVLAGASKSVAATPMTATAEAVQPLVEIIASGNVFAEPMHAQAEMKDGNVAFPYTFEAEHIFAEAEMPDVSVGLELGVLAVATPMSATASWKQPALVNGSPITVNEAEDKFFVRVMASNPYKWYRLNDLGALATDRMNVNGPKGDYVGVATGQFNGPDARHSVYFDGNAYIKQNEGGTEEFSTATNTLEFSIRTTKGNQFIMASNDERAGTVSNTPVGVRELSLKNGRITYRYYGTANPNVPVEFSGFKNLADGEWHRIAVVSQQGTAGQSSTNGVTIYVDGIFEVRRQAASHWTGFPDYIGSRPVAFLTTGPWAGTTMLSASQSYVGDMSEVVFGPQLAADEISRRYYDFMAWSPVAAAPVEAFGFMTDGNTGRGNRKRVLYLWWDATEDKFLNETGPSKMNFDPSLMTGTAKGVHGKTGTFQIGEYVVDAMPVVGPYRDPATDLESLINLGFHVDMDNYDAVWVGDWPDEGYEEDALNFGLGNFSAAKERFISQLRDANDNGVGLLVTHPRMAVDLGIVDRVEWAPSLKEQSSIFVNPNAAGQQGNAVGFYDYGSAVKFPWNISADAGLSSPANVGAVGTGVEMNTSPAYLEFKALFYEDTNFNNRFRVRATVSGLTDIPSYMIKDAVYHVDRDVWGDDLVAMDLIDRRNGLLIGDEFLYNGTDDGIFSVAGESITRVQYGRPTGAYATPLANVKAGTVVTTFGAKHWVQTNEVDNPYKDYATTIALDRGDVLAGRPVGGRIFVSFTESPYFMDEVLAVDILPGSTFDDGTAEWPNNYLPDTPAQKNWDLSTTRTAVNNSTIRGKVVETIVTMPDGSIATSRAVGDGLMASTAVNLFGRAYVPKWDMTRRGVWWVARSEKPQEGEKRVAAESMTATAAMPQPAVVAQRDGGYVAQPMNVLAQMRKVAEDTTGDVEIRTLPATASVQFTGFSKVISAQPMTANATLVENFDMVHATGEQVVLTLHGVDTTLYLKEEA